MGAVSYLLGISFNRQAVDVSVTNILFGVLMHHHRCYVYVYGSKKLRGEHSTYFQHWSQEENINDGRWLDCCDCI